MIRQRTLKNIIRATGIGLHTGNKVYLTLRPAAVDTGIVFRRVDLDEPVEIVAKADSVVDTRLSTTLGNGDATIDDIIYAIDQAQKEYPREDHRHIIVHCQTARFDQLDEMKRLGITPSFFSAHAYYYPDVMAVRCLRT